MILVDFSAMIYQVAFSSASAMNEHKKLSLGEKYETSSYAPYMLYRAFDSLFEIQTRFSNYGDLVLCLDGSSKDNWRKAIYPMYKGTREASRNESVLNFPEVFEIVNRFIELVRDHSPWKVVRVPEAEGDDVVMVLAKEFCTSPVMIISSDKDMIQMQKYGNIEQYSLLTQKFITPETKHGDSMTEWLLEHVILGDVADNVPRIVDGLEFTEAFINFCKENNIIVGTSDVQNSDWSVWMNKGFTKRRITRSGNEAELDIFVKPRFGISNARKKIDEYGTLENWLSSNPRLRENYQRNCRLVLEEHIPADIRAKIMDSFNNAAHELHADAIDNYLDEVGIPQLKLDLPRNFRASLRVEDFF